MDESDLDDVTEISSIPQRPAQFQAEATVASAPAYPSPPGPVFQPVPAYPGENVDRDIMRVANLASLTLDKKQPFKAPTATSGAASPGSKLVALLPWILLVAFLAGGGYYHYITVHEASVAAIDKPVGEPAGGSAAQAKPAASVLLATGYVAARAPIVLSATTSGRVDEVRVESGQRITKGQILARVADKQIRAELGLAGARVRDAQRAHQRTRMLVKAQAATPADLERAMGQVEIARAEMGVIRQKVEETRIRSPIDGTVLEVLARPGETLTVGKGEEAGVLKIADLSALVAEADVSEADLKNVFVGQKAEVVVDAQGGTHVGVVREIAEQADRARGTVLIKVDIEASPDSALRPGMAIQVRFLPRETPAAKQP